MTEDGPEPDGDPDDPAAERSPSAERDEGADDEGAGSDVDAEEDRSVGTADAVGSAQGGPASSPSDGREPGQGNTEQDPPGASAEGPSASAEAGDPEPAHRATQESAEGEDAAAAPVGDAGPAEEDIPDDVRSYDRFQKMDRAGYDRVNEFLRDRTYITAREWAIARLCADFRTATGVEMTKIGEHLPELVPFMTDTYSPQAVNQARSAFENKVRMAGATFLYGAMSGFFTADELDDLMYEVTEVAKFLLEVEGVELAVEEELAAEDRISSVMREVREASEQLRYDDVECPHCGEAFQPAERD